MKTLINIFISIILLPKNLAVLIINLKKINNAEVLLIQNERNGYGNIYTSLDLMRLLFPKKKKLCISFMERHRHHNDEVFKIFSFNTVIFKTCLTFSNIPFGEYFIKNNHYYVLKNKKMKYNEIKINKKLIKEYFDTFNFLSKYRRPILIKNFQVIFLIFLINLIKKRKSKIFSINQLYDYASKDTKKLKYKITKHKDLLWMNKYFSYYDKRNKPNYSKDLIKKIKKVINDNGNKKACIYYRGDGHTNENTTIENLESYKKLIKFLLKKNISVYLTGDIKYLIKYKNILNNKKLFVYSKTNMNKYIFDNYIKFNCDYFFGSSGGGSWPAMYAKKGLLFDTFPLGFRYPNIKFLEKKIYDTKNKKYISKNNLKNYYFLSKNELLKQKIIIKNNNFKIIKNKINEII